MFFFKKRSRVKPLTTVTNRPVRFHRRRRSHHGDAAIHHFESPPVCAMGPPSAMTFCKASEPMNGPFSGLQKRSSPASKTLMVSEISWP